MLVRAGGKASCRTPFCPQELREGGVVEVVISDLGISGNGVRMTPTRFCRVGVVLTLIFEMPDHPGNPGRLGMCRRRLDLAGDEITRWRVTTISS